MCARSWPVKSWAYVISLRTRRENNRLIVGDALYLFQMIACYTICRYCVSAQAWLALHHLCAVLPMRSITRTARMYAAPSRIGCVLVISRATTCLAVLLPATLRSYSEYGFTRLPGTVIPVLIGQ